MKPEDARLEAQRQFGNALLLREQSQDVWGMRWLETLPQDLRYGLRQLRRNPGFTAVAIITLALGIGANTAMFSVIDAVLLRPLPYVHPSQLVSVQQQVGHVADADVRVSYPNFLDWRSQNHVFSSIAAYFESDFTLTGVGQPAVLPGASVSWDTFRVLGERPALGRGFLPQDEQAGSHAVLLSHRLWQSRFGSNPQVIGRAIVLDGKSYTIRGVMQAGFQFPISAEAAELWTAIAPDAEGKSPITADRGADVLSVIARLKPGVTMSQAEADIGVISRRLAKEYPNTDGGFEAVILQPELRQIVGSVQLALLILLGATGFVLLIACANVASLLLSRGASRNKEMAIRAALGAGRRRVVRQLLTETLLLSFLGTGLGLLLAVGGTRVLLRLTPVTIPRSSQVGVDGLVLLFAIVLAFVTAVLFGAAPALQLSTLGSGEALKEGGHSSSDAGRHRRLRNGLVIGETAAAFALLAGAALLIASYLALQRTDPGFNPHQLLTFTFQLPRTRYSRAQEVSFYTRLLARLRQTPGVRSASGVVPLPETDRWSVSFEIEGRPVASAMRPVAGFVMASPGYFHTMGIPILQGRGFNEADNEKAPPVTVVSQAFARRYFPHEDPVGKRIQPRAGAGAPPWREIVGVVGDVKDRDLAGATGPVYYVPYYQLPLTTLTFIVRAKSNPRALVSLVRSEMASMEPNIPLYNIETMEQYLASSSAQARFNTILLGIFASLALLLAAVGLYGVVSYSVSQRTHEIGIRMALGAQKGDVLRIVIGNGIRLALIGIAIGVACALALTRFLSSLLYG
ncbi:MAG: ABC transporter permease, partial [Acidobacteriota bacterium]|nr:ABC transporter permease [Acidobacteriota bacterium]